MKAGTATAEQSAKYEANLQAKRDGGECCAPFITALDLLRLLPLAVLIIMSHIVTSQVRGGQLQLRKKTVHRLCQGVYNLFRAVEHRRYTWQPLNPMAAVRGR